MSGLGRDFDLVEPDGTVVMMVRHLWPEEPTDCNMCGVPSFHEHCVPWYCGPVAAGTEHAGYKVVCKSCHDRWAAWDASLRYCGA
jgi:hypothetical protein